MRKKVIETFLVLVFILFVSFANIVNAEQIKIFDKKNGEWIIENDSKINLPKESIERTSVAKAVLSIVNNKNKVQSTEFNSSTIDLATEQIIPWGVERVSANHVWNKTMGRKVKICVLDSGIGPHNDLNVSGGISFIDGNYSDNVGHGTMVAGILSGLNNSFGVVGVAPKAEIYSVKIIGFDGGVLSDVLNGIDWCIENKMNIITISFGTPDYSQALEYKINEAYDNGIIIVAAAGNNDINIWYPAKSGNVIATSSTEIDNQFSSFSNYGPEIDLSAPGSAILSTYINNSYAIGYGTSFSTPHATGVIALLMETNMNLSASEIKSIIYSNAIDLGDSGRDNYFGYGLVQARFNATEKVEIDNYGKRIAALESWKDIVNFNISSIFLKLNVLNNRINSINNTLNGLITKSNNHETRIVNLEKVKVGNSSIPNYFKYLSSSQRKSMICGYGEDNHLTNWIDLGLNCTLTYRTTFRGESVSCRCLDV